MESQSQSKSIFDADAAKPIGMLLRDVVAYENFADTQVKPYIMMHLDMAEGVSDPRLTQKSILG